MFVTSNFQVFRNGGKLAFKRRGFSKDMQRVGYQFALKLHKVRIETAEVITEAFSLDPWAVICQVELFGLFDNCFFSFGVSYFFKVPLSVIVKHILESG